MRICCAIYGSSYMKSHSETNIPCNSQLLKYIRVLTIKMNGISCFLNPFTYEKKWKYFYTQCPIFSAFWRVPRPYPFVFLVEAACIWRWVWSIGEMILARENGIFGGKKTCPSATLSTTNLRWTSLVLNPGLRGRSQQITACAMA